MKRHTAIVLLSVSVLAAAAVPVQPAFADALSDAQARQGQLNAAIQQDKTRLAQVQGQQAQTQAQGQIQPQTQTQLQTSSTTAAG